jgi:hypothetical protein
MASMQCTSQQHHCGRGYWCLLAPRHPILVKEEIGEGKGLTKFAALICTDGSAVVMGKPFEKGIHNIKGGVF